MENITTYEAFIGKNLDISSLRVYRSNKYVHISEQKRNRKLSQRSVIGILVGCNPGNVYRVLLTTVKGRRVTVTKDVCFDEEMTSASCSLVAASFIDTNTSAFQSIEIFEDVTANTSEGVQYAYGTQI